MDADVGSIMEDVAVTVRGHVILLVGERIPGATFSMVIWLDTMGAVSSDWYI